MCKQTRNFQVCALDSSQKSNQGKTNTSNIQLTYQYILLQNGKITLDLNSIYLQACNEFAEFYRTFIKISYFGAFVIEECIYYPNALV